MVSRETVFARMAQLGLHTYQGNYDCNVIGLRRIPGHAGSWDDLITISALDENGNWFFHAYPATTEPGGKYIVQPLHEIGAAVIAHDRQYRSSHTLGVHGAGKPWAHRALVQSTTGKLTVWHDANRDQTIDYGLAETVSPGTSGLNIHRNLGDFSAGCQVFLNRADQEQFQAICERQPLFGHGRLFTYSLLGWPADQF